MKATEKSVKQKKKKQNLTFMFGLCWLVYS